MSIATFFKKNSALILTCVAAAGTITTAILAAKATPKAIMLVDEATYEKGEELTAVETVKAAAPAYIPAAATCVGTLVCMFGANALNKKQQAVLLSAYGLVGNAYKEYQDKIKELVGPEADAKAKRAMVEDAFGEAPYVQENTDDTILFYDMYYGEYFNTPLEFMETDDGLECYIIDTRNLQRVL